MAKAKRDSSDQLVKSIAKALEPIPYWVGYKHARYWKYELPEAAIVAELRETLLARCRDGEAVDCEVAYLGLGFLRVRRKRPGARCRRISSLLRREPRRSLAKPLP